MKWNIGKALAAGAVTCAVCVGGVQLAAAYQAGGSYVPGSFDRTMQNNQLQFSDNDQAAGGEQNSADEQDSFWEKDENDPNALSSGQQAGYLFDHQQVEEQTPARNLATGVTPVENDATAPEQQPSGTAEEAYVITDTGSEKSDMTVVVPGDQNSTGVEVLPASSPAPGTTPTPSSAPQPTAAPAPTAAPTAAPSQAPTPAPTAKPVYADTSLDPTPPTKPTPNPSDSWEKTSEAIVSGKVDPKDMSVIRIAESGTIGTELYQGQNVTEWIVFNAMDTYVMDKSNYIYYWNEDHLGTMFRVDALSFDNGETWTALPTQIPADCADMKIRVAYRFSTTADWTQLDVDYVPQQSRVYVLNRQLEKENEQIQTEDVINFTYSPQIGSYINLYSVQSYLEQDEMQTALYTGWTENGETVPFCYEVTPGRHILEKGDFVPLPDDGNDYTIELELQFIKDARLSEYGEALCWLQTLTSFTPKESVQTRSSQDRAEVTLKVPEYVQGVVMESKTVVDRIEIPATVMYVDASESLVVKDEFDVDPENSRYTVQDGLLMNSGLTEIVGIPASCEEITVPESVEKVDLPASNSLTRIVLESQDGSVPQMDLTRVSDCEVEVNSQETRDTLLNEYRDVLNKQDIQVGYRTESGEVDHYSVANNCMVMNGRLLGVIECGQALRLPSAVHTLAQGSLSYYNGDAEVLPARVLILPEDGTLVTLQDGWNEGTGIKRVLCYTAEQLKTVEQSGTGVQAQLLEVSKEGYYYVTPAVTSEDVPVHGAVLVKAPEDVAEFDGTVTAQDGTPVQLTMISDCAFMDNTSLRWVSLPQSYKYIGYQAFRGCTSLEGVFIDSRDTITIGNRALDDCDSLRFVASNAMVGTMEDDYVISLKNTYESSYNLFLFKPVGSYYNAGYWVGINAQAGDDAPADYVPASHYRLLDCGGVRALYLCDSNDDAWLALRSGLVAEDAVTIPESTREIFEYAFAGLQAADGGTVELTNLAQLEGVYFYEGAFYQSDVGGDLVMPRNAYLDDYSFNTCDKITSITISDGCGQGTGVFNMCHNLQEVTFGDWDGELLNNIFYDCNALQTVRFTQTVPSTSLDLYYSDAFRFNGNWSLEEEGQKLHIEVPEYCEEAYLQAWRYAFLGYQADDSMPACGHMWNDVKWSLFDWDTWEYPPDSEVKEAFQEKLLPVENCLRTMLGMDTVSEPSACYYWTQDPFTDEITLTDASPDIVVADLSPESVGIPYMSHVDTIAAGAFSRCKDLTMLQIPETLGTIEQDAFLNAAQTEDGLVLVLESDEDLPQLSLKETGTPFSFGIEDEKINIWAWDSETDNEAFLTDWVLPMAGYDTYDELEQAVKQNWLEEHPDEELDDAAAEKIHQGVKDALRTAENRLRGMLSMELLSEEDTPQLWKDLWEDELEPTPEPGTEEPGTDDELKPSEPGTDPDDPMGDLDGEEIPDLDGDDMDDDPAPTDPDDPDPDDAQTPDGPDDADQDEGSPPADPDDADPDGDPDAPADEAESENAGSEPETAQSEAQTQAGQGAQSDAADQQEEENAL